MEGNASPLKPNEKVFERSSKFVILFVACRQTDICKSSLFIPHPLSQTEINFLPDFSISTDTVVAFASRAFSTNSFTTFRGLSTTSPAEILFIVFSSNIFIVILFYL